MALMLLQNIGVSEVRLSFTFKLRLYTIYESIREKLVEAGNLIINKLGDMVDSEC